MKPASIRVAILATVLTCLLRACAGESPPRDKRAAQKESPTPATGQTVSITSPAPGTQLKGDVMEV